METQIIEQKPVRTDRYEYFKEYYEKNKNKIKDYGVSYYWKNRKKILEQKKANIEKIRERREYSKKLKEMAKGNKV